MLCCQFLTKKKKKKQQTQTLTQTLMFVEGPDAGHLQIPPVLPPLNPFPQQPITEGALKTAANRHDPTGQMPVAQ